MNMTCLSREAEVLHNLGGRMRFVEGIEMNSGHSFAQQLLALASSVFDAIGGGGFVVVAELLELRHERWRNFCAANCRELLDLVTAQYRQDSRANRHIDCQLLHHEFAEFEEVTVVEEELCQHKISALADLCL